MGGGPAPRAASTAPPSSRATHRGSLAPTVGEYLDDVEAKRNPGKIVAIGAFLVDHLGKESFTLEEVKAQFQYAGGTPPANFARDFSLAVSNRWIAQAPGSAGNYFVTNTGRKASPTTSLGKLGIRGEGRRGASRRRRRPLATDSDRPDFRCLRQSQSACRTWTSPIRCWCSRA